MPIVGIIAEYNPLHNGHLHHIKTSRRLTGARGVICVISGSFTQRGEPALVNKWARAEMALKAGADLVFELPFVFAARSAYHFARGGVSLLQRTGVTTHLSFGSELGEIKPLQEVARILHQEPQGFVHLLKEQLRKGNSYPQARSNALDEYMRTGGTVPCCDWQGILSLPNNILAVEYLRALLAERSDLIPITIPRLGQGYHQIGNDEFASATAIRNEIENKRPLSEIKGLPPFTREILAREFNTGSGPVSSHSLFNLIRYTLSRMSTDDLSQIYDVSEGLENRIHKLAPLCGSRDELITSVKTRRYSYTRISRILLYILLNFTKDAAAIFDTSGPQYLRLLGFSPQGQKILHEMKAISTVPVITKTSKLRYCRYPLLSRMIAYDFLATDLHALIQPSPGRGGLDFVRSPVQYGEGPL
ncbi:MAG: nucleotidyltransferase [Syntrophomonadaceae bacterium]|nr:nucleotidyltransferase [Syntrophomonadaceae bacterium]